MRIFIIVLFFGLIAVANGLESDEEIDRIHVAEVLSEISLVMRHKYNTMRHLMAAFEPSHEMIKRLQLENDIRLTVPQAIRILENLNDSSPEMDRRIFPYPFVKWAMPIAYTFDGTHSDAEKEIIRQGIDRWQSSTCVTFRELSSSAAIGSDKPGIVFTSDDGCESSVGRVSDKALQKVSLAQGCVTPGIVSHELGHVLGLWHEHMRPDRDNYITINWGNIIGSWEHYFAKVDPRDDIDYGTGYDPSSIMHYDSLGFSVDLSSKKRVIVPKNAYHLTAIGQREYLSFNDVKRVNFHYRCISAMCSSMKLAQPCQNKGYQDPKNCAKCRCPAGFGGDFCQNVASSTGPLQCGGSIIEVPPCSSITLTSPGYPKPYYPSSSCAWRIKSNSSLIFAFEHQPIMNTKFSDTCLDYVDIKTDREIQNTGAGNRFCLSGKSSGRVAFANSGQALVVFSSTSANQGGGGGIGFKLRVYATCNGTLPSEECLITSTGYDYVGNQEFARSNSKCQVWAGQTILQDLSFPDASLKDVGSKCRNPDSSRSPWCFTDASYSEIDYCNNIPQCPTNAK